MPLKNRVKQGFFITGTDTNIGKTLVAKKILDQLNQRGYQTAALKPVASGCELMSEGLKNSDALLLHRSMSLDLEYDQVNPIAFLEPIAPFIAAQKVGVSLSVKKLLELSQPVLTSGADYIVVEGIGGWKQPLNNHETMADYAEALNLPVILVVGLRLGCINHTLLTWESLRKTNLNIAGWVANRIDPYFLCEYENIELIRKYLPCPLLGILPYREPKVSSEWNEKSLRHPTRSSKVTEKDFHVQ